LKIRTLPGDDIFKERPFLARVLTISRRKEGGSPPGGRGPGTPGKKRSKKAKKGHRSRIAVISVKQGD